MHTSVFLTVPFDDIWITSDKLDVHAIYRRPVRSDVDGEQLVDANGVPKWDLTGGLPVKRHFDWLRKGFEYVTLADSASLSKVAPGLRAKGLDPRQFVMLRNRLVGASPWNPKLYLETQPILDRQRMDQLRAMVEELGSDAVLKVLRTQDPFVELPSSLRGIPAAVSPAAPPAAAPSESELTMEQLRPRRAQSRRPRR